MTRCRIKLAALLALSLLGGPAPADSQGAARPGSARFEAGMQSYRDRRYREAVDAFLDVLVQDPGNVEARRYQSAALHAMVTERENQNRFESLELLRLSLHEGERDEVVWNLSREASEKMNAGDLLGASDFLYKAMDLMPGHPEVLRGMERARGLIGLRLNQLQDGSRGFLFMRNVLNGLVRLAEGANKPAAEMFQQALFLVNPGEESEVQLQDFLRRARSGQGGSAVRPAPAAAAPVPPVRVLDIARKLFGPPSPPPGWNRPAKEPVPVVVSGRFAGPPSSAFPKRPAVKLPPAVEAPAAPSGDATLAPLPVPLHIPDMPDQAKSAESYIRGVTQYMAGRTAQARAAMREALRLNPDNQRAQRMLDRIDKEGQSK